MITELWATPILETVLDGHEVISRHLLELIRNVQKPEENKPFNVWDHLNRTQETEFLKRQILLHANYLSEKYLDSAPIGLDRGWISRQSYGEVTAPHKHFNVVMAAVYYPQIPEGSCDLFLYDPRGGDRHWGNVHEDHKDCRIHHRVKVSPGKLVIFPGYLLHGTAPHFGRTPRIALATNLKVLDS